MVAEKGQATAAWAEVKSHFGQCQLEQDWPRNHLCKHVIQGYAFIWAFISLAITQLRFN